MANIHKKCVICGKEFVTKFDSKITCSAECARIRNNNLSKENAEHYKAKARAYYHKKKKTPQKNLAEEAHKLRIQRQREAKKLGLTYAQYIAQKGIKEI